MPRFLVQRERAITSQHWFEDDSEDGALAQAADLDDQDWHEVHDNSYADEVIAREE